MSEAVIKKVRFFDDEQVIKLPEWFYLQQVYLLKDTFLVAGLVKEDQPAELWMGLRWEFPNRFLKAFVDQNSLEHSFRTVLSARKLRSMH